MLFQSVSPDHTPSQTEMAYDFLLDKILSCEYLPGQEISEKMLNDTLPFGRTPIREALMTLKSQNLITVYPRRGMQIRPFTQTEHQRNLPDPQAGGAQHHYSV